MKKGMIFFLFISISQIGISQIIKVENGISISSLSGQSYDKKIYPYQLSISTEYLDKGWFNLSTGIGKLTKGGKEAIPISSEDGNTSNGSINLYVDYLTINTTFDAKYVKNRFAFFLGAGPRIDIKLNTRYSYTLNEFSPLAGGETSNIMYGINCIAGIRYTISKMQIGLNFGYLLSFNKLYTGLDNVNKADKTFVGGVSLGYKL